MKKFCYLKFPTTGKFYSFTGKAKNKHCTAVNCSKILFNNKIRVTITIGHTSKTVRKQLTEELASLGKAIEFGDEKRVARVVMKNTKLNKSVVNLVLKKLGEELNKRTNWRKNLCILWKWSKDDMVNSRLERVCVEMKDKAPLCYAVLNGMCKCPRQCMAFIAASVLTKQINRGTFCL